MNQYFRLPKPTSNNLEPVNYQFKCSNNNAQNPKILKSGNMNEPNFTKSLIKLNDRMN